VVFFFSSRRRHTRSKRDWSSDVCSSDLGPPAHGRIGVRRGHGGGARRIGNDPVTGDAVAPVDRVPPRTCGAPRAAEAKRERDGRSEERRGGKGGGGRWCREQEREEHMND